MSCFASPAKQKSHKVYCFCKKGNEADGLFRQFSDTMPLGVTISEDVNVAGNSTPVPLGSAERDRAVDGYGVVLTSVPKDVVTGENMLLFTITKKGKPVTDLQEYLGALGRSVIPKH